MVVEVNTPDADAIFISCANLRTIEITQALKQNFGTAVITSNQDVMWFH
jgi:maleate cis-trans isomerase